MTNSFTSAEFQEAIESLTMHAKTQKGSLKMMCYYNCDYWESASLLSQFLEDRACRQFAKCSQEAREQGTRIDAFFNSKLCGELLDDWNTWTYFRALCERQTCYMKERGKVFAFDKHKLYMLLHQSPLGLHIRPSLNYLAQKRANERVFQRNVKTRYAYLRPDSAMQWDIIANRPIPSSHCVAYPLFAHPHGPKALTSIFGPDTDPEDLFSARNALLLPRYLVSALDDGLVAFVPDIPGLDSAAAAATSAWASGSRPRGYRVQVMDLARGGVDEEVCGGEGVTWRGLDGTRLAFPNEHRPDAKYMFFLYLCQVLRNVWRKDRVGGLLGRAVGVWWNQWGTGERYVAEGQMRAFVKEVGPGFEGLLENGDPGMDGEGEEEILLAALAGQVRGYKKEVIEEEEEEEERRQETPLVSNDASSLWFW